MSSEPRAGELREDNVLVRNRYTVVIAKSYQAHEKY